MSAPWAPGGGSDPYASGPSPYGDGPVDPYAGRAAAPVPAYNPYVNPGSWEPARYLPRQSVPGTIIGGSIVAYLLALLLFTSGLFLIFFGSVVPDSFDEVDSTLGDGGTSLVVAGLGNWIAVGLLVSGGVLATMRRPSGLVLTIAGTAMVVVLSVYWIVLYPDAGVVFWAVFHSILALIPAGLIVLPPGNRAWLSGATGSGPPVRPSGPPPFPTDRYGRPFGS